MARGPRKHLKRLNAPKHWMLSKLDGIYATRPSQGPHKLRECVPLSIFLRYHLRYALTGREVMKIVKERHITVNGQVRTDPRFPLGLMDIVSINKTGEHFRLLLDAKGRFTAHPIDHTEKDNTLCRIVKRFKGHKGRVVCVGHNGWTFAYPRPDMQIGDSVWVKISDKNNPETHEVVKLKIGCECLCTGGRNKGRVGCLSHRTRVQAQQDIVTLTDVTGSEFSTQLKYLFVIGKSKHKSMVDYGKGHGVRKTITDERKLRQKGKGVL